jgi:hypothetical protein
MALARGTANTADQSFGWYPHGWVGGFLAHLHSRWGYDEPEILRNSNRQFGPIGADAGQGSALRLFAEVEHHSCQGQRQRFFGGSMRMLCWRFKA